MVQIQGPHDLEITGHIFFRGSKMLAVLNIQNFCILMLELHICIKVGICSPVSEHVGCYVLLAWPFNFENKKIGLEFPRLWYTSSSVRTFISISSLIIM